MLLVRGLVINEINLFFVLFIKPTRLVKNNHTDQRLFSPQ